MIPPKERCEQILTVPNFDVAEWTCPVCRKSGSRAHWVAEHALEHIRRGENSPKVEAVDVPLQPGMRPLDLD